MNFCLWNHSESSHDFCTASNLLICMDADKAGHDVTSDISSLYHATQVIRVSHGKDITEFYQQMDADVV